MSLAPSSNPMWMNLLLFAVAAAVIWLAGSRLERLAHALGVRTGFGSAFAGLILLAMATSLPEVATTVTATLRGEQGLAVHNLLGGVAAQTAVLVITDAVVRGKALTGFRPTYALIMQGVGLIALLSIVVVALALRAPRGGESEAGGSPWGTGFMLAALAATYLAVAYAAYRAQDRPRWRPVDAEEEEEGEKEEEALGEREAEQSIARLAIAFAIISAIVLAAGWSVALLGETLATQTGLGTSFIGVTLVTMATSLPEVSTTTAAARRGHYRVAVSNIFGSNLFDVTLLVLAGALASGPLIGDNLASPLFAAGLGILLTTIYLWGLLEHQDRTLFGIGYDSAAVAVLYGIGIAVLYTLR